MSAVNTYRVQTPSVPQLDHKISRHNKPILEAQLDLLNEGKFSDVTFIVGPSKERIPCHQLFLKIRSPVFEAMFSDRWNQDKRKEVLLKDLDPKIFKKFLQYIYADTFVANVPQALELLPVAHKYQVESLVSKCEELLALEVTLDDAVDVIQASQKYEKSQLMDKVEDSMPRKLLPRALQFSPVRPQSTDSATSVALYPGDFVHSKIRRQQYVRLKECLEFNVGGDGNGAGSLSPPALLSSRAEKTNIVLSSISFYCPTKTGSLNWGSTPTLTKEFKILVKARSVNSNRNYEDLFTSCPVKTEEGSMMEIKIDSEVPVVSGLRYCIIVDEITSPQGKTKGLCQYDARDFGKIRHKVSTTIGETCVDIENIRRDELKDMFFHGPPQLIYKLGLKEC